MKPRSQSLGSLSVNSPNSPARYEPITNIPMRMAASYETNNNQGFLHDSSDFENDCPLRFVPSKLRRSMSHGSICLKTPFREQDEEEENSTTNKALNNNHIYAELDLREEIENKANISSTEKSTEIEKKTVLPESEKCESKTVIEMNNINESMERTTTVAIISVESVIVSEKVPSEIPEVMQNSIDAHLDKIDELNRTLDNRLKRNISPQITDLDAIESAEIVDVLQRGICLNENPNKRFSTSSSDKEVQVSSNVPNEKHKKRSLSFSQKSINAILCNIKEFSKSPLSKMHITTPDKDKESNLDASDVHSFNAHNKKQTEESKVIEMSINSTASLLTAPASADTDTNSTQTTTAINNDTKTTPSTAAHDQQHSLESAVGHCTANSNPSKETHIITSKLKFKVPKIQKKSKAIRQTFRSKFLHFQLRKGKICKTCTKRRRIHPSKNVFDSSREFKFNTANDQINADSEEFCTCPLDHPAYPPPSNKRINISSSHITNCFDDEDEGETSDDVMSLKDHCYCVPSLAMSVSKSRS